MKTQHFTSLRPSLDLPEIAARFERQRTVDASGEPRSWYSITNLSSTEAEVSIYDEIGFWGITASDFIKDFSGIKASKINLRVNSPGGDVFDGIAIHNAIKRHSATVNVYVDGLAASIASVIAMAGDKVIMSPYSQMMIHEASGFAIGNAADMRKLAEMLDKTSDTIANVYAAKAGGTAEEWRACMKDETWYTDNEAVAAGLADEVEGREPQAKNLAPVITNEAPSADPVEPTPPDPDPVIEPEPVVIDWKAVFQEAVEMAEDDLFAPLQEAV